MLDVLLCGFLGWLALDGLVANACGIPAGILLSILLILPPELRNIYMKVPDFSGVCLLCHSREPAILHDPPHCEACLGPSERAYLSLFGLRDSQRSCFRGS